MGGKLNLKGGSSSTKPKKKTKTSKFGEVDKEVAAKSSARAASSSSMKYHDSTDNGRNHHDDNNNEEDEDLTAAEKRSRKFKQMREKKEMEQVVRWAKLLSTCIVSVCSVCILFRVWLTKHYADL